MQQLGFIMKGLAMCYHLQLVHLESIIHFSRSNQLIFAGDMKGLMSLLNGDHLWNTFVKKQSHEKSKNRGKKTAQKPAVTPNKGERRPPMNIMNIRELLSYTKDRLDFLSSH